jgi:hypothetical protein
MPSRGFATAAILISIALACLALARRMERDRRLLATLREHRAFDCEKAVPLDSLSPEQKETAESLAETGVIAIRRGSSGKAGCYLVQSQVPLFRRKRTRLAVIGAMGALALAVVVAILILRR